MRERRATFMLYWFLLLVASSMGDEENLQLLPRAPPLDRLPTCDVFLAPSTIPGSACMNINSHNNNYYDLCAVWIAPVQILYLEF